MSDYGFFGPASLTWRINREVAVLAGSGGRALLMQVAHPLVAAAVAEHSRYASDPIGRLRHTLEAVYAFGFAETAEAMRVIGAINRRHGRVNGTLTDAAGAHPTGSAYRALDPTLMLWVYATLIDSSAVAYERFVAPLSPDERDAYFHEMRQAGTAWGIPASLFPASMVELRAWMQHQVDSGQVAVGAQGRAIARRLLAPPAWWVPGPAMLPSALATTWLLPPAIRDGFEFPWGPRRERTMRAVARVSRALVPRLPHHLRDVPYARAALRRLR